jgi:hypothetical protein
MAPSTTSQATGVWTWSAVLAGVVASLIVQVLLTMLGLGIGLMAVDVPATSAAPVKLSTAAALWWWASGIFAAFVGGAVAGAYASAPRINTRIAHAIAAWATASLIVIGAASLSVGGAANVLSNLAGPTSTAAARLQTLTRPAQPGPQPSQAQLDAARKALAATMLASFIALLFGGGAAFLGGWWSKEIRTEIGA